MEDNFLVSVSQQLEQPIIEKESITITQISEYDHYLVDSQDNIQSGDICAITNFIMNKLKSLGHDGSLKIDLTRFIYEEVKEVPFNELQFEK